MEKLIFVCIALAVVVFACCGFSKARYYLGEFKLTAYCSCQKCCGKWSVYKKTASGKDVKVGMVAVDKKIIPLGSLIYIEGLGYYRAEDTGSAIKGNRIDIYFDNHLEALQFGVKHNIKVWLI